MKINVTGGEMDPREIDQYISYGMQKYSGKHIKQLDINIDGNHVDLKFYFGNVNFQRAYRSTDYLVNNIEKLNDAKQAEYSEKQRHWIPEE